MRDYEDVTPQAEARDQALLDLKAALGDLAEASKRAARSLDVNAVYAATNTVRRAEENYDLACLDLATARGEDA